MAPLAGNPHRFAADFGQGGGVHEQAPKIVMDGVTEVAVKSNALSLGCTSIS